MLIQQNKNIYIAMKNCYNIKELKQFLIVLMKIIHKRLIFKS